MSTVAEHLERGDIEVSGCDLVKLAQVAYSLSVPKGLGFLHAKSGALSEAEAREEVEAYRTDRWKALGMDYVNGRAVKLSVYRASDAPTRLFMRREWYDHSDEQLGDLLQIMDIAWTAPATRYCAGCSKVVYSEDRAQNLAEQSGSRVSAYRCSYGSWHLSQLTAEQYNEGGRRV